MKKILYIALPLADVVTFLFCGSDAIKKTKGIKRR